MSAAELKPPSMGKTKPMYDEAGIYLGMHVSHVTFHSAGWNHYRVFAATQGILIAWFYMFHHLQGSRSWTLICVTNMCD